jgi:hypothetical protein
MDILERITLLPEELRQYILKYTHKLQPTQLIDDIRDFTLSKDTVTRYYFQRFHHEIDYQEKADKHWLINDIAGFLNNHIATMNGYIENYQDTFKNLWGIKENKIVTFIRIMGKKQLETEINIYWGSMSVSQRD